LGILLILSVIKNGKNIALLGTMQEDNIVFWNRRKALTGEETCLRLLQLSSFRYSAVPLQYITAHLHKMPSHKHSTPAHSLLLLSVTYPKHTVAEKELQDAFSFPQGSLPWPCVRFKFPSTFCLSYSLWPI